MIEGRVFLKPTFFYALLVVIASSSYGILSTIVKLAMGEGFTAAEAITSQYVFGFLLALILLLVTQRQLPKLSGKGFFTITAAGLFTATTGIIYGQSLNYLPASLAVVMLFQFTWIGLLLDCIIKRRLPSRAEALSLPILFAGTLLATGVFNIDLSGIPLQGWIYGLLSALSFAIFIQINSRPVEGVTMITRTFIVSAVALLLISFTLSPEIMWNGQLSNGLWKYGLILGLFGIILPVLLLSIAVPKVGGGLASILSAMELPVAITVSVWLLPETITAMQIAGVILVLIGMTLPSYFDIMKTKKRGLSRK